MTKFFQPSAEVSVSSRHRLVSARIHANVAAARARKIAEKLVAHEERLTRAQSEALESWASPRPEPRREAPIRRFQQFRVPAPK